MRYEFQCTDCGAEYEEEMTVAERGEATLKCPKCGSGKVLTFYVKLDPTTKLEAVAGDLRDTAVLHRTQKADPSYKLNKKTAGGGNWT